jgi:hypothetical protein
MEQVANHTIPIAKESTRKYLKSPINTARSHMIKAVTVIVRIFRAIAPTMNMGIVIPKAIPKIARLIIYLPQRSSTLTLIGSVHSLGYSITS